jgi:hypothetical protein
MDSTEPKPIVTRISVDRLYNLGNYEHIKYGVTVDIPAGEAPTKVLKNLLRVLRALNPRAVRPPWDLQRKREIAALTTMDCSSEERTEREAAFKEVTEYDVACEARNSALEQLDNLGGTTTKIDAKHDWDLDDED